MDLESMADEDIIELTKNNGLDKNTAVTEIYNRYKKHILAISWKYLKNGELVKENLGDVSEKLVEKLLTYEFAEKNGYAKFGTWIYHITKNSAIDLIRYRKKNCTMSYLAEKESMPEEKFIEFIQNKYCSKPENPESVISRKEVHARLNEEINKLNENDFKTINEFYFECNNINEVYKKINLNKSTIRARHFRALKNLKKKINGNKNFFYR